MSKEIYVVQSAKGGIGKSMLTKTLIHHSRQIQNSSTLAFDMNVRVRSTATPYGLRDENGEYDLVLNQDAAFNEQPTGAILVNLDKSADKTSLFELLAHPDAKYERAFLDFGADEVQKLESFFGSHAILAEELLASGADVVIVHVLDTDPEPASSVIPAILAWGPGVKHVAALVKGGDNESDFDHFNGSRSLNQGSMSPKEALEAVGGVVLNVPTLFDAKGIAKMYYDERLPFHEKPSALDFMNATRVRRFLAASSVEFDRVMGELASSKPATAGALAKVAKAFGSGAAK